MMNEMMQLTIFVSDIFILNFLLWQQVVLHAIISVRKVARV